MKKRAVFPIGISLSDLRASRLGRSDFTGTATVEAATVIERRLQARTGKKKKRRCPVGGKKSGSIKGEEGKRAREERGRKGEAQTASPNSIKIYKRN